MLRRYTTPLLLVLISACQSPHSPQPESVQASLAAGFPAPTGLVVTHPAKLLAAPLAARGQDSDEDQVADPDGWDSVDSVSGQPVDTIRKFYDKGGMRRIYTQLKGRLGPLGHHGRSLSLFENGVFSQESFWELGKLNGPYREWFEGGQIKVEAFFEGGQRHGVFKEYGSQGTLRAQIEYQAGRLNGEFRQWFASSDPQEVSHWKNGKKEGLFRLWDRKNTPLVKEIFVDGVQHGEGIVYHRIPDVELVHQIGLYQRGSKSGVWLEYNPEGEKVQAKEFVRGKVTGYYKEWRGGVLTLETRYVENVENGERAEFYASGKPFSKGIMEDGGREGPWFYWEEDGSVQTNWSGIYKGGNKVSELPSGGSQQVEDSTHE